MSEKLVAWNVMRRIPKQEFKGVWTNVIHKICDVLFYILSKHDQIRDIARNKYFFHIKTNANIFM